VWSQADKYGIPRIAYINKMDRIGADFFRGVEMMVDRLGANPVALQLPIGRESEFTGIIDLVEMNAIVYLDELGTSWETVAIPEEHREVADMYRLKLVEAVADHDDHLLETYLEGGEITAQRLRDVIRAATLDINITPVLCGSSFKNKGVQPLLDAVVDYLPSPLDVPPMVGILPKGGEATREPSDQAPFSALAFKVAVDPHVGKLTYFRVYSGTLRAGSYVYNSSKGKRERISRILQMHANRREDREDIYAGELAAAVGLKVTGTGDTLCAQDKPIILESMEFPEPVIAVAIEPKTKADEEKLAASLQRLAEEDPTFRVRSDEETGQTIISGMGELHLEIIVDRLLREFKVDANVGKPQVAYRETVRRAVNKVEGRFVRQTGGRGQYGHVVINMAPGEPGGGYMFENLIVGGAVPREYIPAVDEGIQEAMNTGVLAGYPMVDVKVALIDGSFHEVDSSDMAFKIAGSLAFKNAAQKAHPVLLEPVVAVEVVTPAEFMGDVIGDLNSRRGHVSGMEPRGTAQVINATVPLSMMFGYATDLRSATQGRATYSMQFTHYAEVPASIAAEVVARVRGA
jgi:elongation factor G